MIFLLILGLMSSNNHGKLIFNFREDKRLKMTEMLNSHRHKDSAVRKKLQKKKAKMKSKRSIL